LNATLTEEIYMQQPQGFITQAHKDKVLKLNKSLYGLKQASREWNNMLKEWLIKHGYKQLISDQSVFVKFIDE
jgi:hypothetical protein